MVEPEPHREYSAPHRDRKTDNVVGVDEIVRRHIEIELREHAALEADLEPIAGFRAAKAQETERIADADGPDVHVAVIARLVEVADERALSLRVGEQRTEDVPARQGHVARCFA